MMAELTGVIERVAIRGVKNLPQMPLVATWSPLPFAVLGLWRGTRDGSDTYIVRLEGLSHGKLKTFDLDIPEALFDCFVYQYGFMLDPVLEETRLVANYGPQLNSCKPGPRMGQPDRRDCWRHRFTDITWKVLARWYRIIPVQKELIAKARASGDPALKELADKLWDGIIGIGGGP